MILIQARSTSTRFPNKMMQDFEGEPMVRTVYKKCLDSGIAAMVLIPIDDPLKEYLRAECLPFFEGSETDVLDRYYKCAKTYGLKWVIRVTGDCPLISPATISYISQLGQTTRADFVSNCIQECTDGQEVEFISFRLLEHINLEASKPLDREHVTTFIKKKQKALEEKFGILSYVDPAPIGPKMSVDTPADLDAVRQISSDNKNRKRQYV